MSNVHIVNVSRPLGEGPLFTGGLVQVEPEYSAYRDRFKEISDSCVNELGSPYYLNIIQGQEKPYVEKLQNELSTEMVKASILSELCVNEIFNKVPLLGWEDTKKLQADEILIEQKIIFEFLAKIELLHSGILPLHSYGNIDGDSANHRGMRYLTDEERNSVGKIDWLNTFINTGEANTADFTRKSRIEAFIPILLHETYSFLVRNNMSKRDALRVVMTALAPIRTLGSAEKYQSKMYLLEGMGKRLPVNSDGKREFDELLSMYSSGSDSILVPLGE